MFKKSRRSFLTTAGVGLTMLSVDGFSKSVYNSDIRVGDGNLWQPFSDRKVKVGLIGYGFSKFAADFGFQNHPNVEVVAVSDLIPERCAALAKAVNCNKTYPSLEALLKDNTIEAVYIATDAPSHARHSIQALKHGKHVAVAVPAVFDSLEEAEELLAEVKKSGKKYMMFETSCYREDLYAMHKIYEAGGFGRIVYSEGEYLHYGSESLPSFKDWRSGMPPMYYLTHATAYYVGVTGGSFSSVSCLGIPSHLAYLKEGKNRYNNNFGTQVALFNTTEGGLSRMMYSKDTRGPFAEEGRVRGERGSYTRKTGYDGEMKNVAEITMRPPLPEGVPAGGHGGSHGRLTDEFIRSILQDRKPWVDVAMSLNMSVPGIVAHQSSLRNGELLNIPKFTL